MENKQKALVKLRQYTESGKTYFEASRLLGEEGFTQADIADATAALNANKITIEENPELAKSIVSAESIKSDDKAKNDRSPGHAYYPGGGLPLQTSNTRPPTWVYVVGGVAATAVLVVFLTR